MGSVLISTFVHASANLRVGRVYHRGGSDNDNLFRQSSDVECGIHARSDVDFQNDAFLDKLLKAGGSHFHGIFADRQELESILPFGVGLRSAQKVGADIGGSDLRVGNYRAATVGNRAG